jgi:hypothetical protein
MNVIQFYSHLLQVSHDAAILSFLEPKIPDLLDTLAPDADTFQSLLATEACEFLSTLRTIPSFPSLDDKYHLITILSHHALNPASQHFLPGLMAFSHILSTDGYFSFIDLDLLASYRRMISTRPITPEKLTSLGLVLSNASNLHESFIREGWFTIPLTEIILPYLRDPTMKLSPVTVLSALANHVWGVKLISSSKDAMNWLQDRIGDYQQTTAKFSVLRKMLATTKKDEITKEVTTLDREGPLGKWRSHVEIFVAQGEWWRNTVAEVVAEGI